MTDRHDLDADAEWLSRIGERRASEDPGPAGQDDPGARGRPHGSGIRATPYVWRPPEEIPRRAWVYDRRLIRRFLATTVAPGGIGKSSLELVEAVAIAIGRPLLGVTPAERGRVWYWCGEDPIEEIERRVAAIVLHYDVDPTELEGWLFLDSGRTSEIVIAETTKAGTRLALPVIEALTATIRENEIDVVILDPFISTHRIPENDNGAVDLVAKALNRVAEVTNCAFELVHHVRKGMAGAGPTTVEDGRGAGALLAAARSARVLNQMTKEEAERAGIDNPRLHFRADNGKANLAPPPDGSTWYRLASVSLCNGPAGPFDFSDHVAVVTAWEWPDVLAETTVADLHAAQAEVAGAAAAGMRFRLNVQARDWIGRPIARALRLDPDDRQHRARIKAMVRTWVDTGMFTIVSGLTDQRKPCEYVEVGTWACATSKEG